MSVVGCDPSLRGFGICRPDGTTDSRTPPSMAQVQKALWVTRTVRIGALARWFAVEIADASLIVIESPFVGGKMSDPEPLYWMQGEILRRVRPHHRVIRIAPMQLQKFAVKGGADKATTHDAALNAGWAGPSRGTYDDNQSDSWWARAVGCHIQGDPVVEENANRNELANDLRVQLQAQVRARQIVERASR